MRTEDEIRADARNGMPFSSGEEGGKFESAWCSRCVHDESLRDGTGTGCPVQRVAIGIMVPAEWKPFGGMAADRYRCSEFTAVQSAVTA